MFRGFFDKHGYNFEDVSKMCHSRPKIKIFRNNGYEFAILDYDVTNKVLWLDSNYIVDVVDVVTEVTVAT